MKMDSRRMAGLLEDALAASGRSFLYDKKNETIRIENTSTGKGITVELPKIVANWENVREKAVEEVVYYVEEALKVLGETHTLQGREKQIFPVIRAASFPEEASEGNRFLYDEHTAETRIYYALDLGKTYRLIDEQILSQEKWDEDTIREIARFNVRSLKTPLKSDQVAGNTFYFLNTNDGYDASRILNEMWLKEMKTKMKGTMAVAIPHQDVIIIGDIENETGYDVLAQMAMSFFTSGHVPITALSFLYEDDELEPVFILGKNKKPDQ